MPPPFISGVILTGAPDARFPGSARALAEIGGRRILDRLMDVFAAFFEDIVIVAEDPLRFGACNALVVREILPRQGVLTGIHAGLFHVQNEYAFLSDGGTPLLQPEVVRLMIEAVTPDIDVVVPETPPGSDPPFGVYAARLCDAAAHHAGQGESGTRRAFRKRRVRTVSEKRIGAVDPQRVSLIRVNTPEDLDRAGRFALPSAGPP